ncbi:MAG: hypothetical protein OEZ20_05785 [candidate division WOR-3 bacterium]|nr:hypothetical protein [candidate division WOR-3 bacterium]
MTKSEALELKPLGPRFQRLRPAEIEILAGKFAGKVIHTLFKFEPTKTTLKLKMEDKIIGTAHADYEPAKRRTTLFDTYVQNEYQMQGLASLMVHLLFREQLVYTDTNNFDIRMVMKATGEKEVIENVGMGLIALKIGFEPDINYQELFAGKNVTSVDIIPAKDIYPFGYKLSLRSSPWTIVIVLLDPLTDKPHQDLNAYEHFVRSDDFIELVKSGQAVLGNVDYVLGKNSIENFVSYIAENQEEMNQFLKRIKAK